MSSEEKHTVPAIISAFLPGVGQMFKGQIIKGIAIVLIGWTVGALLSWTFIVPTLIWIWNIYDAYND